MEKLEESIGPGTAGIAQRIPSIIEYETGKEIKKEDKGYKLNVLKYNKVMPCSQNQY